MATQILDVAATNAAREAAVAKNPNANVSGIKIYKTASSAVAPVAATPASNTSAAEQQVKDLQNKVAIATQAVAVKNKITELQKQQAGLSPVENANLAINAGQDADAASKATDEVPTRRTTTDIMNELKGQIGSLVTTPEPVAPDLATDLQTQRSTAMGALGGKSVNDVEASLADINSQIDALNAQYQVNVSAEKDKPVAQNVIEGRLSQQQQNYQNKLVSLNAQKSTLTTQLSTAYSIISTIMDSEKQTYEWAKSSYDSQYSKAVSLINAAQNIADKEQSDEEQAITSARANAQVIYNSITSGGMDISNLSESQKLLIQKTEIQAGLPEGFYATLQLKNPKANILSTTTRQDSDGSKYADIIMQDENGRPTVQSIYLGKERLPESADQATKDQEAADKIKSEFMKELTDTKLYNNRNESLGEYRSREEFIKALQARYWQIDPGQITQAVYQQYPDKK